MHSNTVPFALSDFNFGRRAELAVASRVGLGPVTRPENQDNFVVIDFEGRACRLQDQAPLIQHLPHWPAGHGRVAVLDGMGGHGHGREAAEAVAAALLSIPPCATVAELARRLDGLHTELQRMFVSGGAGAGLARPGTTLTLLELPPGGEALLYHVGDSRLYELGPDAARPLTVDHVPATALAMTGLIDEAAWWRQVHGRHAPQIAQAFILGNAFVDDSRLSDPLFPLTPLNLPSWLCHLPDRRAFQLRADRCYLLATDGFWSCAHPDRFVGHWPALFAGAPGAVAVLERLFAAIEDDPPSGLQPDNLTALVLRPLAPNADETVLPGVDSVADEK